MSSSMMTTSAWRYLRLGAVVLVFAIAGVVVVRAVWHQQAPSVQELRDRAGLGDRLRIGVTAEAPGISKRDDATKRYSGFEIEIAYLIAADLNFRPDDVDFLEIESEDRERMQASTGEDRYVTVDLVIATYSITEQRKRDGVRFSEPYLRTEQSVITRKGHGPVATLADLKGEKVCVSSTTTGESSTKAAGVFFEGRNRISECVTALLAGTVAAVTTDAAVLAGFVAQHPNELQHHDIGLAATESWAVNARNDALRQLVNLSLHRSACDPKDRRWEEAFDRYLRPLQPASERQQVAVDEQPEVARPDVREWPWERLSC